ncbi:ribonuclease domain-containing protein [Actinocatenispora thailandica]|uniref:ribonuclease domain-containing protein n=1 Tax=Actinocatenispora thailandica TaxID=227318 RepID=UPI003B83110E
MPETLHSPRDLLQSPGRPSTARHSHLTSIRNVSGQSQGALILPGGNGVTYREWDVNSKVKGVSRGEEERLVTGSDGSAWYTDDHYKSFYRVR